MARVNSHSWDNRSEMRVKGRYRGWTRRLTWYCASWSVRDKDIRIRFEDELGLANKCYGEDKEAADRDWNDFRNKALTTAMILHLA